MSGSHAVYAPSAAERWTVCTGSVQLSNTVPPGKSSVYADEGTAAHTMHDMVLNSSARALEVEWPDHVTVEGADYEVNEAMKAAVLLSTEYILNLPGELFIEQRVKVTSVDAGLYGRLDAAVLNRENMVLEVIDFKYGAGVAVDIKNNMQLTIYGLGMIDNLDLADEIEWLKITITQPRRNTRVVSSGRN